MIPILIFLIKYIIPLVILLLISIQIKAQQQQSGWVLTAISPTTFGWTKQISPSDTSTMLVPYLRKIDTASISGRVNSKLNIPDTSDLARKINPSFTGTQSFSNSTLGRQEYFVPSITTTNATPVLIASIVIPTNKTYYIEGYMMAVKSDGSTRNCGSITGVFSRVTGNLSQDGSLKNDLIGVLSTTKLTYVLNNTTHSVEIYANGLASTTINWDFLLYVMYKL